MSYRFRKLAKFGALGSVRWLGGEAHRAFNRIVDAAPGSNRPLQIAMISDLRAWCSDQQYNPFNAYRDRLQTEYGISVVPIYLDKLGCVPPIPLKLFDVVMVKLSYQTDESAATAIVSKIKQEIGDRPLIYMDGDDDLCVQWPGVIATVDLYVKAQAFRDRTDYTRQYLGKSNLHDYAIREHGHILTSFDYGNAGDPEVLIDHSGQVRQDDLGKIVVGWNMALSEDILKLRDFVSAQEATEKTLDCVFRGSVQMGTITGYMRSGVLKHLQNLSKKHDILVTTAHVSKDEYYQELLASRICVSPFGFGELCWRDFEAALCRSLLIKPDMSHVETVPDIFQPYVTYVPVKWDLSDLEETCTYYLEHEAERHVIAEKAYAVLDDYYRSFCFGESLERILNLVLEPRQ